MINKRWNMKRLAMGAIFVVCLCLSCRKFVEVEMPNAGYSEVNVFTSDATAISTLTGLYVKMSSDFGFATGRQSIALLSSLSADDLELADQFLFTEPFYQLF